MTLALLYLLGICFLAIVLNGYVAGELFLLQESHIRRILFLQRLTSLLLAVMALLYVSETPTDGHLVYWTLPVLPYLLLLYQEARELRTRRTSHLWYQLSGTSDVVLNTCVITILPETGVIINTAGAVSQMFGVLHDDLHDYESFYGFLRANVCIQPAIDIELMIAHLREGTLTPALDLAFACTETSQDLWVRQTVGHVTNIYRETVAINLYYTSITKEKQLETDLVLIQHALDNLPLGVVITDADRRIQFINKVELAYHEITDPADVLGRPSSFLGCEVLRTMPPDLDRFEPHLTINTTLKQLIPKLFPCSLTSNYVEDATGRTLGIVTICQPITPMTSTVTNEVLSMRDRIAAVSQQTDVLIIILKADRSIRLWNRYAAFLLGWTEDEVMLQSHNVLNLVFGPTISTIEQMITTRLSVEAKDVSLWAKDGTEFRVLLTVHPLITGEMAILGVVS